MATSGIELKAHSHSEDQLSPSTGLQTSTNDSVVLLKSGHDDKKQVLIKLRNVVILALIFMTLEIIGGLLADSIAILSDAAHMLSDLLSFAISIISVYISTFPPNSRNSFGYHRAGVVGALASVVLIWVLTAFLVYYAIDRIFNLHKVDLDAGIMLGTSIIGLGMNLVMVKVLHGSGHGHDCGHSHGHGHSHAHSHSHLEGTECSHDHAEHHHHASEAPQDYSPPVHDEAGSSHTHNHGSHKHSQFSNYRKESESHSHQHGTGHEHNPHKHSKKPPSIKISPNKRYGRGEYDSPVQRLIASSPAETQNKSSPPNDKANISTDKTETSLTDHAITGADSQRDNPAEGHAHHHHDHHDRHTHSHKEHHHHDHDHGHNHSHSHSKSHSHHDHDHHHDHHHHHEEDLNIRAAMIHIIGDILQSIGVIIASVVIMFNPEKFKIIDPILTIIFSIIVLFTTKRIVGDCLNVIMQSTPVHIDADEIKGLIELVPNVKSVHNLHIWSLTVGKPVLSAHVFADGDLSEVLAKVTKVCRKEGIKHTTIQIEYIHDEEHQNFINCDHEIC